MGERRATDAVDLHEHQQDSGGRREPDRLEAHAEPDAPRAEQELAQDGQQRVDHAHRDEDLERHDHRSPLRSQQSRQQHGRERDREGDERQQHERREAHRLCRRAATRGSRDRCARPPGNSTLPICQANCVSGAKAIVKASE